MATLRAVQVRIRPATEADVPRLAAIKRDAGVAAWPHILPPEVIETLPFLDRWATAIGAPDPRIGVLVAESGGRVVGFAVTRPSGDPDADAATGELDGFYVDPPTWGIGAGRSLLAAATQRLRDAGFSRATLWTAEANHRPRRIYDTAGWRTDGTERRRTIGRVEFVELRFLIALDPAAQTPLPGERSER
jgi:GNAT superfamily N-acetyltransferase